MTHRDDPTLMTYLWWCRFDDDPRAIHCDETETPNPGKRLAPGANRLAADRFRESVPGKTVSASHCPKERTETRSWTR